MIDKFEHYKIISYINNFLKNNNSVEAFKIICNSLDAYPEFFGVSEEAAYKHLSECLSLDSYHLRKQYRERKKEIIKYLTVFESTLKDADPGYVEKNVSLLTKELGFDKIETSLFSLILRNNLHLTFRQLLSTISGEVSTIRPIEMLSCCLGLNSFGVTKYLGFDKPLTSSGILSVGNNENTFFMYGRNHISSLYEIPESVCFAIDDSTVNTVEDLTKNIIGDACTPTLLWEDFDHIQEQRDRLEAFLTKVVSQKIKGVNILLWGPPGTGKTEFSKTLADRIGAKLYSLDDSNSIFSSERTREQRKNSLQFTQSLLKNVNNTVLLFDEMDDLFVVDPKSGKSSKMFMNRILENNEHPIIWTINSPSKLGDYIIRRMAVAVEMKVPSKKLRENVWNRILKKNNVDIPDTTVSRLAEIEVSPAVASSAVKFARLVGSSEEDFNFVTHGIIKATKGISIPDIRKEKIDYRPELVNTKEDMELLTNKLCAADSRAFSLCLYGPPGTGKSEYVRHLAASLDMPVLVKRASDIISKWVGESEQNIAKSFQEAKETGSFLVFDEADSLLGDRRYAQRSWELSQVNEMLTWMESHPLPFACTTNLKERLDKAAMRRFTFKYNFEYLLPKQVIVAFKHFFDLELSPSEASTLCSLTPGDFAVVKKKLKFLSAEKNTKVIMDLLKQEVGDKNETVSKRAGFVRKV